MKGAWFPKIADEDHPQKAPQKEETINGAGTDKTFDGAPQDAKDKRDSEETAAGSRGGNLAHRPTCRANACASTPKLALGPAGCPSNPQSKRPDKEAAQDEATVKEKKIKCGRNAREWPRTRTAE